MTTTSQWQRGARTAAHIASLLLSSALFFAASPAHALPPADEQEIQHFTLSEDFLQRYEAIAADTRAEPQSEADADPKEALNKAKAMMSSVDAMTAEISKSPKNVAIVQKHGLTPRQVAVGGIVLVRAQMADSVAGNPKMAKYLDDKKTPSPANMAFYRAHKSEIAEAMKKGK